MFAPLAAGPDRPAIVTDVPLSKSGALWAGLEGSYTLAGELGWISDPLRPVTGNRFTPTYVYLPRGETGAADSSAVPSASTVSGAGSGARSAP